MLVKLAKHLPGMLYQFRRFPDGRYGLPYASPGVVDLFGVKPENIANDANAIFQRLHPDDLPRVEEGIAQSASTLKEWEAEFRVLHPDGRTLWIAGRATPELLEDNSILWHGYLANSTERKEMELALQASNEDLEQFAYVASHDLRQPLRMINSYLQLLERSLDSTLKESDQKMLHFATEGAQRLDQMLLSLLEYSRIGRKGLPMTTFSMHKAVAEALKFLAPQIEETGAKIHPPESGWPQIHASLDEMTRLFQNLIGNALKYSAADTPPKITLEVETQDDYWRVCVLDEGIGIDPEQQDRLFKVFQRLHTKARYEGTGIGLAICRKIVERHGGSIWVESEGENKGSRFCFLLPKATAPAAGSETATCNKPDGGPSCSNKP